MKAIQFQQTGEPSGVLTCTNLEKPKPASGEVLVRMLASPVNPSDLITFAVITRSRQPVRQLRALRVSGIVEESGGGLRGSLFKGKRVVVASRRGGNWGEYNVVPASQVIPVSRISLTNRLQRFLVNPAPPGS